MQAEPKAQAAPEPKPEMREANAAALMETKATSGVPAVQPVVQRSVLQPEVPHPSHDAREGFGFVTTSAIPDPAPLFTSERPSTMFAMTSPVAYALAPTQTLADGAVGDAEVQPETEAAAAVPLPDHKPKVVPKPRPRARAAQKQKKEEWMPPWLR